MSVRSPRDSDLRSRLQYLSAELHGLIHSEVIPIAHEDTGQWLESLQLLNAGFMKSSYEQVESKWMECCQGDENYGAHKNDLKSLLQGLSITKPSMQTVISKVIDSDANQEMLTAIQTFKNRNYMSYDDDSKLIDILNSRLKEYTEGQDGSLVVGGLGSEKYKAVKACIRGNPDLVQTMKASIDEMTRNMKTIIDHLKANQPSAVSKVNEVMRQLKGMGLTIQMSQSQYSHIKQCDLGFLLTKTNDEIDKNVKQLRLGPCFSSVLTPQGALKADNPFQELLIAMKRYDKRDDAISILETARGTMRGKSELSERESIIKEFIDSWLPPRPSSTSKPR